eukprot:6062137-Prymnesium_polylepis.1
MQPADRCRQSAYSSPNAWPSALGPKCARQAQVSRSDQVGPLPLLFTPPRTRAPAPKSGFVPVKIQCVTAEPTPFHSITRGSDSVDSAMLESPGRAKADPGELRNGCGNARFSFATHAKLYVID